MTLIKELKIKIYEKQFYFCGIKDFSRVIEL